MSNVILSWVCLAMAAYGFHVCVSIIWQTFKPSFADKNLSEIIRDRILVALASMTMFIAIRILWEMIKK